MKNWRNISWSSAEYRRMGKTSTEYVERCFELEDDETFWTVEVGVSVGLSFDPMDREVGIMQAGFLVDDWNIDMLQVDWGEEDEEVWRSEDRKEIDMCFAQMWAFAPVSRMEIEMTVDEYAKDCASEHGPYEDYEPDF